MERDSNTAIRHQLAGWHGASQPVKLDTQDAFGSLLVGRLHMRYAFVFLAVVGIVASSLALREHYRTEGFAPCDINAKWDCGIVNQSPYAMLGGIPVAVIGIAGYLLMGALALKRAYRLLLGAAVLGLGFSLYLAHVERDILGVWCVYCVISLGTITLMSVLALATVLGQSVRHTPELS
jgi:vitamin-K-epoxide reductase (warfarin-sensitive)